MKSRRGMTNCSATSMLSAVNAPTDKEIMSLRILHLGSLLAAFVFHMGLAVATEPEALKLKSAITHVQPMTGIVLWTDNDKAATDAVQLEFRYCGYNEVVNETGQYDFSKLDRILDEVAARRHQAILRFYFEYVGKPTTVPDFIKRMPDYRETIGKSEGKPTHFGDWSHPALQQFTLDFTTRLAERYDRDPRIAFLETGFGLWAEYHIYDGPNRLGAQFPDKPFQTKFLKHMAGQFKRLPWMISVDAVDSRYSPLKETRGLLDLNFGVFDDSFLCKQHPEENALNWKAMQQDRWQSSPAGGEFSYYTNRDQKMALEPNGPHGVSFEKAAAQFHISFMIGNDQPKFQTDRRIKEAGMATGYRFRVTSAERIGGKIRLVVTNEGVAPIYQDAYFATQGKRSTTSLRGLLPGQSLTCELDDVAGSLQDKLSIQCDWLVPGQEIQFAADLP